MLLVMLTLSPQAWVCVVMLSDPSTMIGGETAIQCGGDANAFLFAGALSLTRNVLNQMGA